MSMYIPLCELDEPLEDTTLYKKTFQEILDPRDEREILEYTYNYNGIQLTIYFIRVFDNEHFVFNMYNMHTNMQHNTESYFVELLREAYTMEAFTKLLGEDGKQTHKTILKALMSNSASKTQFEEAMGEKVNPNAITVKRYMIYLRDCSFTETEDSYQIHVTLKIDKDTSKTVSLAALKPIFR